MIIRIAALALVIAGSAPAAAPPSPVVRAPRAPATATARAVVRTDAIRSALGTHRRRLLVCRLAAMDGGTSCNTTPTISTTEWTVIRYDHGD